MSKIQYLTEQAARAERLARSVLDTVTVERLQAFAASAGQRQRHWKSRRPRPPDLLVRKYGGW